MAGVTVDQGDGHGDVSTEGQHLGARPRLHTILLVFFGVGYLLLTVGWGFVVGGNQTVLGSPVPQALYVLGLGLAVAAAPMWFTSAFLLSRTSQSRLGWMLAGVIVLMPWPAVIEL